MISAMDALALPGCTLSDEEREGADALERTIDACIQEKMSIKGIIFHTKELRPNVIVETGRRYRLGGWNTEWSPIEEENRFNKAARKHIGWQLAMAPSEAAYAEHGRGVQNRPLPLAVQREDVLRGEAE